MDWISRGCWRTCIRCLSSRWSSCMPVRTTRLESTRRRSNGGRSNQSARRSSSPFCSIWPTRDSLPGMSTLMLGHSGNSLIAISLSSVSSPLLKIWGCMDRGSGVYRSFAQAHRKKMCFSARWKFSQGEFIPIRLCTAPGLLPKCLLIPNYTSYG